MLLGMKESCQEAHQNSFLPSFQIYIRAGPKQLLVLPAVASSSMSHEGVVC